MSTTVPKLPPPRLRMTDVQRRIVAALSKTKEVSNAQVADAANCSEPWASRVLHQLERLGMATSRVLQDGDDPQTRYRLWRRA